MKILWQSAAPWISTGYGRVTKELVTELHGDGHEIAIQSLASVKKDPILWYGDRYDGETWVREDLDSPVVVYPSTSAVHGEGRKHFGTADLPGSLEDSNADFLFTHFDSWMEYPRKKLPDLNFPYSSYVIVDHYPAPGQVVESVQNAQETVAMSKYGKLALQHRGVRPAYIPHGVDTDLFRPLGRDHDDYPDAIRTKDSEGEENRIDIDDVFIVGMVAANHADRKHIPEQFEAFNIFRHNVDEDALLYIHSQQKSKSGFDLYEIQKTIGIPEENILYASPELYHRIGDRALNQFYNVFDVMINCSRGESWGLTITEAISAGVPCVVTDFSSMPEQLGSEPGEMTFRKRDYDDPFRVCDHGVAVRPSMGIFRERVSSKQYLTHPEDIALAIQYYYDRPDIMEEHGKKAREYAVENYDWSEQIAPQFKRFFNRMEEQI